MQSIESINPILTVEQAAIMIKKSSRTIQYLAQNKHFEGAEKKGSRWFIPYKSVLQYMQDKSIFFSQEICQ
jgi:hypothetical protein